MTGAATTPGPDRLQHYSQQSYMFFNAGTHRHQARHQARAGN